MKLGRLVDRRARPRRADGRCDVDRALEQLPAPARRAPSRSPTRSRSRARSRTHPAGSTTSTWSCARRRCSRSWPRRPGPTAPTSSRSRRSCRRGRTSASAAARTSRQMSRSQQVAAAVALARARLQGHGQAGGRARRRSRAPTRRPHGKIQPTDVIVGVDGKPVQTPDDLRRLIADAQARRDGEAARPPQTAPRGSIEVGTIESQRRAADRRGPGRAVGRHQAADRRRHRPRPASAGPRRGSRSRSTSSRSCAATSTTVSTWRRRARSSSTAASLPIGGVKQKVIGARRSGADVFLVPAGENAEEARRHAGDLRIIPVESFRQALQALATLQRKP